MGKKVIIAEKPSVAREFAKVLEINGKNNNGYIESEEYIVTWCVGHLVTMSYPESYDEKLRNWRLSTLPFIPKEYKYEIIDNVSTQFEIVKDILNREDVDMIYVCTDSGREGEYIYRLVDNMAGNPDKVKKRVWIDSQTKEAILDGIKNAKDLSEYNSISDSAYLRAKEDYLIGINFSRLFSIVYGKSLANKLNEERAVISIGRVMTCVLGMIVNIERKIRNFKKVNFYKVQTNLSLNSTNEIVSAQWKVCETSKYFESPKLYNETGFIKKEEASQFIEYLSNNTNEAIVKSITKKKQKESPPLLFNLAELQNSCSKLYKISPDETLNIVQELYEKKMVTYPRTDARVLSTAVAKEINKNLNFLIKSSLDKDIKKYLDIMVKEKYKTNLLKTKYVNDSKITDHYAIIPTGQGFENYAKLSKLQKSIYHLIVRRFISIFFEPAEYNKLAITFKILDEEFSTNAKVCIKRGYLDVIENKKESIESEINEKSNKSNVTNTTEETSDSTSEDSTEDLKNNLEVLNKLKKGDKLIIQDYIIKEGVTSPPSRYSSGSIILAMENAGKLIEDESLREQIKGSGIGTSATRAEIIKKLEKIGYIAINKKTQILTPTNKGEVIFDIVNGTMPDLLDPKLTASWEKGLSMVADKTINADEFMQKLETYVRSRVVKFKNVIYGPY